jgi:hypothetical protein
MEVARDNGRPGMTTFWGEPRLEWCGKQMFALHMQNPYGMLSRKFFPEKGDKIILSNAKRQGKVEIVSKIVRPFSNRPGDLQTVALENSNCPPSATSALWCSLVCLDREFDQLTFAFARNSKWIPQ